MDPVIIISIVSAILFVGVIASASLKPIKWLGSGAVRILIGAIALFVINLFGNLAGIHMPINLFTSSVAGILGIPGVIMLFAVHYFVLPF
ncbi:inhibitor of pro-sigmaK processing BofA [Geomicrobium sp. JCM 19037]|uniref:pro-sigmaK processing inhibitor BofA family protein n=1 Tax=unclassified Geomicrobium TaxID=2628951 RepID=UPI00045F1E4A|nr:MULTISPECIES: pro-sigmaK processing inhibitor BofA family protein [unclassified Geomicrobium]GAK04776.1 inhibitor of pro-sigmaK processing BofA [Geomicrobium sp. JCM 19037]GAK11946.1 inhibitor of pro-sigmaK processing BofA [Geomicrobium sp. JCM 19039]